MSAGVPPTLVKEEMHHNGRNGVRLAVRLTPKASRTAITGIDAAQGGRAVLKVAVTTVPEKGKANAALIKLLAKFLGLPKSAFLIVSGETDRNKQIFIESAPGEVVKRLIERLDETK